MKKVAIVEYGIGNLDSVARAVEECGATPVVTADVGGFREASAIILPGVGAFATGMQNLRKIGLVDALEEEVLNRRTPFLGICLGMQLMASTGWEGGVETCGLGWIDGDVCKLQPAVSGERIPHVGWNEVAYTADSRLFEGIPTNRDFYFVHSYHVTCRNEAHVIARTPYCHGFVSAIASGNLFGVQFHPEKSQRSGFQVIRNFLSMTQC